MTNEPQRSMMSYMETVRQEAKVDARLSKEMDGKLDKLTASPRYHNRTHVVQVALDKLFQEEGLNG